MGCYPTRGAAPRGWHPPTEIDWRQVGWAGALMALDDPGERPDQRDEDREDDTDRAIKLAREYVIEAVEVLVAIMRQDDALNDDRIKAATTLLEVAGCL